MTNKENEDIVVKSSRVANTVATFLVDQVLDEACIIVDSCRELGLKWRSESKLNTRNKDRLGDPNNDNLTFTIEMGDSDEVNDRSGSNTMTTSTPQKCTDGKKINIKADACIIGQGDEEYKSEEDPFQEQTDLNKSTSTFINRLFDMSDFEFAPDDRDVTQKTTVDINYTLSDEIPKVVESVIESALNVISMKTALNDSPKKDEIVENASLSESSTDSSYSFLEDAFATDFDNATFSKFETNDCTYSALENNEISIISNETIKKNDVAFYENAYITLNRDYEQYSDEEEFVQQDAKSLQLQEVELAAVDTTPVELPKSDKQYKSLATTSGVSTSAVSHKSGLVRRCRMQGARLLSCLRGWWWRRKLPGRRKEPRVSGAIRGQCPLSPSARLRGTSLLDHRLMRSPSPSRPILWKFNTINESMVNSAQWNEYAYQTKTDCEEY